MLMNPPPKKNKTKQNKQTNKKTKRNKTKQDKEMVEEWECLQTRQGNVWYMTDLLQEEYNSSFLAITFFSHPLNSFTSQVPAICC